MRYFSGECVSNSVPISQEISEGNKWSLKCDLKVKRFRLWQIASRNMYCTAEIVLHWVPSVMSKPGLFKFLGWFHLFQGFEFVMWTKFTWGLIRLVYSAVGSTDFTCAGFGVPFLLPAQEVLLYPAGSKAISSFEGSYPYKVQRKS